ncbi:hypothetical protein NITMOv2_1546 [Nitrospira moscoviensis]|uniref:Uncharacterized protein n=2 Tax=Nitrospira moscoviensis TaxID=42253 RepID=A0A0K2GAI0_NITMO|nr:hypothetical protein NITMOv2_1546 [Nitrospira moscoviensis]
MTSSNEPSSTQDSRPRKAVSTSCGCAMKSERSCKDCRKPFLGTEAAQYGPCCRWKHREQRAKKYIWTADCDQVLRDRYDGTIKGRAAEIAALLGWPTWVIKRRAAELGLTYHLDPKPWTKEEEAFLLEHVGTRLLPWIARKLHRSLTSVKMKCRHMELSVRYREGYTLRELELCFGCDHRVIERWVREQKLQVRRRGTERTHDAWYVTDRDLLRFIIEHPLAFPLRKVDQFWFMDLVTNGGLVRKALQAASQDESDHRAA